MQKTKIAFRLVSILAVVFLLLVLLLSNSPVSLNSMSVLAVGTKAELVSAINANNNANIKLTADIDLSGASWNTISSYSGTFDGQGHVVSGLNKPLFTTMKGTVKNLGVIGTTTQNALLAKAVTGTVQNTFVYGTITHAGGKVNIGGLAAELSGSGSVKDSFSCVNIVVTAPTMETYVGGLIGSMKGGTVTACYSTGTIDSKSGFVAGLANQTNGTVSDTYTTCQLKQATPYAKPSGVDGLYDNQLGLARESISNKGLTTKELMSASVLSKTSFAVTSTAYPALHSFYADMWSGKAKEIVKVSIAAAVFSDVEATARFEPDTFVARADYLTRDVYIDRTNMSGLKWSIDSEYCKVYDTVPTNTISSAFQDYTTGTGEDLLRARFSFTKDVRNATMSVTSTKGYEKHWFVSSDDANPYFASGKGTTGSAFTITSMAQLDAVRYYTLMEPIQYKVTANISGDGYNFYPIESFQGTFDGGNRVLSGFNPIKTYATHLGLFADTVDGSTVKNIILENAVVGDSENDLMTGALIGSAIGTTVTGIQLRGTQSAVSSLGTAGGLIGEAKYCTLSRLLVSVELTSENIGGGIIGAMTGGTMEQSGSTGLVSGKQYLGGLVGKCLKVASGKATGVVKNCYSTATVVSSYATAGSNAYVGGLIGDKIDGSMNLSSSYAASFVYCSVDTGVGALIGKGTVGTYCYYDGNAGCILNDTNGTKKNTTEMIGAQASLTFSNSGLWTKADGQYPQIKYFVNTTGFSDLSLLSSEPVYYQQYWNDAPSMDMSTGWISKTFGPTGSSYTFEQPSVVEAHSVGSATVYDVTSIAGWGFEADPGAERLVMKAASNDIGIRTFGTLRENMQKLTYNVVGSGVSNVNTYIEIYYSTDKSTWSGSQMMSVSGGTSKRMYDIPNGSYIKVRVTTDDDYVIASVTCNGVTMTKNGDYYESATAYTDQSVEIVATVKAGTPAWGLHKQTY